MNDLKEFRRVYWGKMPKDSPPDEYSSESGNPFQMIVDEETYKKVKNSENGIRMWQYGYTKLKEEMKALEMKLTGQNFFSHNGLFIVAISDNSTALVAKSSTIITYNGTEQPSGVIEAIQEAVVSLSEIFDVEPERINIPLDSLPEDWTWEKVIEILHKLSSRECPDFADVYEVSEFARLCESKAFVYSDGDGAYCYRDGETMFELNYPVSTYLLGKFATPSEQHKLHPPPYATHVAWYNK